MLHTLYAYQRYLWKCKIGCNYPVKWCFSIQTCSNHRLTRSLTQLVGSSTKLFTDKSHYDKHIPGWNDYCKEAHSHVWEAFLLWVAQGKTRYGPIFNLMKQTRTQFKHSLRNCRSNEAIPDSLAKTFISKDHIEFWKEIRKKY